MYPPLAVHLEAPLGKWTDASVTGFYWKVDCMPDIVDEEKHCHVFNAFLRYYDAAAGSRAMLFNKILSTTCDTSAICFDIATHADRQPSVKVELPQTCETYEHLFALVVPQHNISQLAAEFGEYQVYILEKLWLLYCFGGSMYQRLTNPLMLCIGCSGLSHIQWECRKNILYVS